MPRICYIEKNFRPDSLALIAKANATISSLKAQGYDITLRQLYYQLVSRNVIPNNDKAYDRLGALISDARLAGLVDWNALEDRTRYLRKNPHWETPRTFIDSVAPQYALDKWATSTHRVEVWVEKDALVGIVERACAPLDVPFFSCRGYVSQSEMWAAAQRLKRYRDQDIAVTIIHLGDHDPSGLDMSRDIQDRMNLFVGYDEIEVARIALNRDQIDEYGPPPNPAKITDSRSTGYIEKHGHESWELDALAPSVIEQLITDAVARYRDDAAYSARERLEKKNRQAVLKACSNLK